jgi:hypothetical protein
LGEYDCIATNIKYITSYFRKIEKRFLSVIVRDATDRALNNKMTLEVLNLQERLYRSQCDVLLPKSGTKVGRLSIEPTLIPINPFRFQARALSLPNK